MAVSFPTLQEKIALAIEANEAGNYAAALTYLESAEMVLASTPDVNHMNEQISFQTRIKDIREAIGRKLGSSVVQIPFEDASC